MAPTTTKIGFHRPHPRVTFTGEILDRKTGELIRLPSLTKQSFVDECDINKILKQYKKSGLLRHINAKAAQGAYADLPDDADYQTALHVVMRSQDAFATLPSSVRNRFANDPAGFLAFMADPANEAEIVKLGLAKALVGDPLAPPKPPEGGAGVPPAVAPPQPPAGGSGPS